MPEVRTRIKNWTRISPSLPPPPENLLTLVTVVDIAFIRNSANMPSVLLFVVTLLGIAFAVSLSRSDHVVHERRAAEPIYWAKIPRLESDGVLPTRFGPAQQNLRKIEEMLMSVSYPESPRTFYSHEGRRHFCT